MGRLDDVSGDFLIASHRVYSSFGLLTDEYDPATGTASGVDLEYGFTARFTDPLTGMTHHQFRWYDPQLGKWISEDPLGFAAGDINTTRYVANAPLTYTDPTGLIAVSIADGNDDSRHGILAYDEPVYVIGIHSGTNGNGGGHSWVSIYIPERETYITYGLYPDNHATVIRRGLNDADRSDVRVNFERNFGEGDHHRYINATSEQLRKFNEFIEQDHRSSANHTCAEWASQCWQHTTGEYLNPNGTLGFETPQALSKAILIVESEKPTSSPRPKPYNMGRPTRGNDGTSCCG